MQDLKLLKAKRVATGIMALMMLVVVLFSFFYIAVEAGHDCRGENCPICAAFNNVKTH